MRKARQVFCIAYENIGALCFSYLRALRYSVCECSHQFRIRMALSVQAIYKTVVVTATWHLLKIFIMMWISIILVFILINRFTEGGNVIDWSSFGILWIRITYGSVVSGCIAFTSFYLSDSYFFTHIDLELLPHLSTSTGRYNDIVE